MKRMPTSLQNYWTLQHDRIRTTARELHRATCRTQIPGWFRESRPQFRALCAICYAARDVALPNIPHGLPIGKRTRRMLHARPRSPFPCKCKRNASGLGERVSSRVFEAGRSAPVCKRDHGSAAGWIYARPVLHSAAYFSSRYGKIARHVWTSSCARGVRVKCANDLSISPRCRSGRLPAWKKRGILRREMVICL